MGSQSKRIRIVGVGWVLEGIEIRLFGLKSGIIQDGMGKLP